jgi:hypothetical protein
MWTAAHRTGPTASYRNIAATDFISVEQASQDPQEAETGVDA